MKTVKKKTGSEMIHPQKKSLKGKLKRTSLIGVRTIEHGQGPCGSL